MSEAAELQPVNDETLQTDLSVILALNSRRIPVLHGKGAPMNPVERDRLRREFAVWLTGQLKDCGYRFLRTPPHLPPPSPW